MRALAIVAVLGACGGRAPAPGTPGAARSIDCEDVAGKATQHVTDTMPVLRNAGTFAGGPVAPTDRVEPAHRTAGSAIIVPPDVIKVDIQRSARHHLVSALELCLDDHGVPASLEFVKSSGYPEYDLQICRAVRDWRYTPYRVNDQPRSACTGLWIIYNQGGDY